MLGRLSWRNIWRNTLRSTVIMVAIALGLTGGVFAVAMFNGMTAQMVNNALETSTPHIRIQHPQFSDNYDLKLHLSNINKIEKELENSPHLKAFSTRTIASVMIASPEKSVGVQAIGIDPEAEKKISIISESLQDGKYFEGMKRNPILISQKIAKELKLKVRSKIVLTVQDIHGDITNVVFRVVGIYKTVDSGFDGITVFVRKKDLQQTIGVPEAIHEIAIKLDKLENISTISEDLTLKFLISKVDDWTKIRPELASMSEMTQVSNTILLVIILFALAFGILNTMLMALYERTKEIGVLMAVGMNKSSIFIMIVLETFLLSIFGALSGVLLSLGLVSYFQHTGINLQQFSDGFEQFGMSTLLYPTIEPAFYGQLAGMVFLTALLSALYPAWRALKLNPISAIRG